MVLTVLSVSLSCYQPLDTTGDTGGAQPTLALKGPCGRYAWLALEDIALRLTSDEPCSQCGVMVALAPDESGYRSELTRDDGVITTSWVCSDGEVAVRQVTFGDDPTDVDQYDPPAVRWIDGTPVGGGWTTTSQVTQVRGGELQDVFDRTDTYVVEAEETLDLPPGLFDTVRLREQTSGDQRWVSEGFGLIQAVDEDGSARLTGLSWPGEDTGG